MEYWYGTMVTLAAIFVSIIMAYFKRSFTYWKRKNVPYAKPSIPFGNIMENLRGKGLFQTVEEFYHEYKAKGSKHMGCYFFAKPFYNVIDLDLLKGILSNDFQHFMDRGLYYNERDDPLSAHLFMVEGNKWKTLRAKLTPTFSSGKMKMMFNTLVAIGHQMEEIINQFSRKKEPLDIKDILARYSTDVIGSCAFGIECNSLKNPNAEFRKMGRKIFTGDFLYNIKGFITFAFPSVARTLRWNILKKDVSEFFMDAIKNTLKFREDGTVTRNDFMQILLELKNGSSELGNLTVNEIAAQAFVFFIAGYETSSTAMTFSLYELSKLPVLQDKVRKEINEVIEKHEGKLTYEGINEMKMLGRVVEESLRKYPPVPMLNRICTKTYKVPDTDVTLDANTCVFVSISGIHNDPNIYPNPEIFDPDRFTEEAKSQRHPYAYIPFGEGPRNCIGLRFGLMQTKVGLSIILKNFKITMNEKTPSPLVMDPFSFSMSTNHPIWLNSEKI